MTDLKRKEIAECGKCGNVKHNNGRCPQCGRMCKGHSLAPKGPRKKKLTGELTQKEKEQLRDLIVSKNMTEISAWFAGRALTLESAFKFVKELAPYISPKLNAVESTVKKDTSIKVTIEGFNQIEQEASEIVDITPEVEEELVESE